jgi:hypothetical protein
MSKIDEFSQQLAQQNILVRNIEELLEKEKLLKARYANELADEIAAEQKKLEAESAKPRTFTIAIDGSGDPVSVGRFDCGEMVPVKINVKLPVSFITVREVKPLRVTRDMGVALNKAWEDSPADGDFESPKFWLPVLKAAGIDAVAAE